MDEPSELSDVEYAFVLNAEWSAARRRRAGSRLRAAGSTEAAWAVGNCSKTA